MTETGLVLPEVQSQVDDASSSDIELASLDGTLDLKRSEPQRSTRSVPLSFHPSSPNQSFSCRHGTSSGRRQRFEEDE